jgi:hypothetical protein
MSQTQNVLVTIKAPSKEEAMKFARTIKNFAVDEQYGAIDLGNGTFVVRGVLTGDTPSTTDQLTGTFSDGPIGHF